MNKPIAYLHKLGLNDKGEVSDTSLAPADFANGWTQEVLVSKSELDEADRRAGAAERELTRYKDDVARLNRVRDRMKEEWGVHYNTSFDKVWEEALALKRAADANSKHNPQE